MATTRGAQAAACFLVELGNGDKFLFDLGTGSAERISSLQIPYDFLDKVFIGHLHADHFGSLAELFIGGALMGRHRPLRIWGPSGAVPEMGTAYAVDGMERMLAWDLAGRAGQADRDKLSKELNWEVGYSDFIESGKWDAVDDALRGVYKEASEALGQEFVFPKDIKK